MRALLRPQKRARPAHARPLHLGLPHNTIAPAARWHTRADLTPPAGRGSCGPSVMETRPLRDGAIPPLGGAAVGGSRSSEPARVS